MYIEKFSIYVHMFMCTVLFILTYLSDNHPALDSCDRCYGHPNRIHLDAGCIPKTRICASFLTNTLCWPSSFLWVAARFSALYLPHLNSFLTGRRSYTFTLSESKWGLTATSFTDVMTANLNTQPISGGDTTSTACFAERSRAWSQISSPGN